MAEGSSVREHCLTMISNLNTLKVLGVDIDGESQGFQETRKLKEGELFLTLADGSRILVVVVGVCHINSNRIQRMIKDGLLEPIDFDEIPAKGGNKYFITFTDDYSRYGYVYLMKRKSEVFEKFKEFRAEVENQLGKCIMAIRSDHGGEYLLGSFKDYLTENGIGCPAHVLKGKSDKLQSKTEVVFFVGSRVVLAEMNEHVIGQPMDETKDGVNVLDTPQDTTHEMSSTKVSRHSGRIVRPPIRFIGLGETYEAILEEAESDPYTYEQAINDIDAHHWVKAMKSELDSMYSNQVWDLVDAPNGIKPLGCK
ncbi:uncharacterized protein LOC136067248 [Quercus suber]|uniref:uncharacterized protein LOC136067248 n=1 Tax=Quercus suber TaxID=58331 RepID=UPI0032DFB630